MACSSSFWHVPRGISCRAARPRLHRRVANMSVFVTLALSPCALEYFVLAEKSYLIKRRVRHLQRPAGPVTSELYAGGSQERIAAVFHRCEASGHDALKFARSLLRLAQHPACSRRDERALGESIVRDRGAHRMPGLRGIPWSASGCERSTPNTATSRCSCSGPKLAMAIASLLGSSLRSTRTHSPPARYQYGSLFSRKLCNPSLASPDCRFAE